jgi:hypothetical protein
MRSAPPISPISTGMLCWDPPVSHSAFSFRKNQFAMNCSTSVEIAT